MHLTIIPPDVNAGQYHLMQRDNGEIVYGIGAIKGVGEAAIEVFKSAISWRLSRLV